MTTKKLMATLGALLMCTGVMADTFTWNPTVLSTDGDYKWENASNWLVDGAIPSRYPGYLANGKSSGTIYTDDAVFNQKATIKVATGKIIRVRNITLNDDVTFTGGGTIENSPAHNQSMMTFGGEGKLILSGFNLTSSYSSSSYW